MRPSRAGSRASELAVFDVVLGDDVLVVVSLPAEPPRAEAVGLTRAERAVARHAMAGLSNAAIARQRASSPRTVANQLAAVYRKLGVSSRAELAAMRIDDAED